MARSIVASSIKRLISTSTSPSMDVPTCSGSSRTCSNSAEDWRRLLGILLVDPRISAIARVLLCSLWLPAGEDEDKKVDWLNGRRNRRCRGGAWPQSCRQSNLSDGAWPLADDLSGEQRLEGLDYLGVEAVLETLYQGGERGR
jgi:hypothetical protein